jgi:hypothetical protein
VEVQHEFRGEPARPFRRRQGVTGGNTAPRVIKKTLFPPSTNPARPGLRWT